MPSSSALIPMSICTSQCIFSHSFTTYEWLYRDCDAQIYIGITNRWTGYYSYRNVNIAIVLCIKNKIKIWTSRCSKDYFIMLVCFAPTMFHSEDVDDFTYIVVVYTKQTQSITHKVNTSAILYWPSTRNKEMFAQCSENNSASLSKKSNWFLLAQQNVRTASPFMVA
jgi:hypothetical protein